MEKHFRINSSLYVDLPDLISGESNEQYQRYINFISPMAKNSSIEVKAGFVSLYKDFIRTITGEHLCNFHKIDPFYKLTQQKFEELYMINSHSPFGPERIFTPYSFLFCDNGPFKVKNRAANPTQKGDHLEIVIDTFSRIPITKEYSLGIGFVENRVREKDNIKYILMSAGISLDKKAIEKISHIFIWKKIQKKLGEITGWFNHDLTAHGTLLADYEQSAYIKERAHYVNDNAKFVDESFYFNDLEYGADDNPPVFAGEMWSISLHAEIYKEIIKLNPSIEDSFIKHFEDVITYTSELTKFPDVQKYVRSVYGLMFLRIINPDEIKKNVKYKKINKEVPYLLNAPDYEKNLRKRAHTNNGLTVIHRESPIHLTHEEVAKGYIKPLSEKYFFEKLFNKEISAKKAYSFFEKNNKKLLRAYTKSQKITKYEKDINDFIDNKIDIDQFIEKIS